MNKYDFREIGDGEEFDVSSLAPGAPFTQAPFYGDWQRKLGREVLRFAACNEDGETICYFQLVKFPLLLRKSYLYAPYGPVTRDSSDEFLRSLKNELEHIARREGAVFMRLDFTPALPRKSLSKFFSRAPLYTYRSAFFQPRAEWFLDLNRTENELLMDMHEKTRYSIRLAARKGVTADIIDGDFERHFEPFYKLLAETGRRNGFHLHPKNYYRSIFQNLPARSFLAQARYGQKILAMNLVIVYGSVAHFVFGGSSGEERHRVPSYLAHWSAIQHAKLLHCESYNFGGVSTQDGVYSGWGGLTAFKKKFGGRELAHSPFFDVVAEPLWYRLYNFRKLLKRSVS